MKLSEKIAAIESGEYAVTWTTADDLDTFAAANHYTA